MELPAKWVIMIKINFLHCSTLIGADQLIRDGAIDCLHNL